MLHQPNVQYWSYIYIYIYIYPVCLYTMMDLWNTINEWMNGLTVLCLATEGVTTRLCVQELIKMWCFQSLNLWQIGTMQKNHFKSSIFCIFRSVYWFYFTKQISGINCLYVLKTYLWQVSVQLYHLQGAHNDRFISSGF